MIDVLRPRQQIEIIDVDGRARNIVGVLPGYLTG
jgi:hypothetical protein